MNVKKIFVTLITIVACVILGAFLLNTLMPNVVTTLINATENMIFKATSLQFDFNNDGVIGNSSKLQEGNKGDTTVNDNAAGDNVEGFGSGGTTP